MIEDLAFWASIFGGSIKVFVDAVKHILDERFPDVTENHRRLVLLLSSVFAGVFGVLMVGSDANIIAYAGYDNVPEWAGLIVSGVFLGGFGSQAVYELVTLIKAVRHFFEKVPTQETDDSLQNKDV